MKKTYYATLVLLASLFANQLGLATNILIEPEKIPIAIQDVILAEEGIFLNVNGELVNITGVIYENSGFYAIPTPEIWICDGCGHHNLYGVKKCWWCGRPRN